MGKVKITGLEEKHDEETYQSALDTGDLLGVHVMEEGGDHERTACTIDLVHGAISEPTKDPVSCAHCMKMIKAYKKIKLGRG